MTGAAEGLAAKTTVYDYLELWNWDGTPLRIHHALYVGMRERAGREASPTAAVIGSQSVKGAEKGGVDRSIGLRRGQKGQGLEASFPGWHARPPADCAHASSRYPRPRRRLRQRETFVLMMEKRRNSAKVQGELRHLGPLLRRRSGSTLLHRPRRCILTLSTQVIWGIPD